MHLIETLTRAADAEQLRLHPLPTHAAAEQEEHLRRHYALLLAAVLTAQPQVSETQSRLLVLLLDALALGDLRAALFEEARALEEDALLEAVRLVRDAGYGEHLLLDVLVLLRLDAPLSDDAVRLAGELASFVGLDAEQMQTRAQNAAEILGLGEQTATHLASLWPERLPRPLTAEALHQGLDGGLWYLNSDLTVNFAWKAKNAMLLFAQGVKLKTDCHAGEVLLSGCQLHLAQLEFLGEGEVVVEDCGWDGTYANPCYALSCTGMDLKVMRCKFASRAASAIKAINSILNISESNFNECGSEKNQAGAINFFGEKKWIVSKCHFEKCIGQSAGAIYTPYIYEIKESEFIDCRSIGLSGVLKLAVFTTTEVRQNFAVINCIFRDSSLSIGSAYYGGGQVFIKKSQFQNGFIYYHSKYSNNTIHSDCTFENSQVIEKRFQ